MKTTFYKLTLLLLSLHVVSCNKEQVEVNRKSGFDDFVKGYNLNIKEWLQGEMQTAIDEKSKIDADEKSLDDADEKAVARFNTRKNNNERLIEKLQYRIDKKEFISQKTKQEIPQDLVWENGSDVAEKGDSRAKKGGAYHTWIQSFPPTIRPIGPNANNSFRGYLHDNIEMGLVGYDYLEKKFHPALAKEWAYDSDGRTVYFRLDPNATFSDGVKVTTKDLLYYLYIRLSDNITAPFQKQYFKNQYANITTYGENIVSVSLPEPKPLLAYYAQMPAAPAHFYNEYGPDYAERYAWRIPPTTGAYTVKPEDIKKGRSITLSRVKDWWAKDMKHYRYSYNVDKIVYTVIAEKTKAFELFKLGKIDSFLLGSPDYWYEKMEVPQYFKGHISKATFYNVYPRVPRGLFLNVYKKPLDNLDVRKGIAHAMNFNRANAVIFRGDSQRLQQFSEGFGDMTKPGIKARKFSVQLAQEYFTKAGYDKMGDDGILRNAKGEKLVIQLSWGKGRNPSYDLMMELLKEDAQKVGLEIQLDGQQNAVYFKNIIEKRHQMCFSGWGVTPPFPRYFQFFHSENAFDDKGNIKLQTNNLNSYANPRMDKLCEAVRGAKSLDDLKNASHEIQQIVHDEALFIPALKTPYIRLGYWRWMKWPQTKHYEFSGPIVYEPLESYSYWIDEEVRKETLDAVRSGKIYPEKNYLFDLYKDGLPPMEKLEQRTPTQK